MDEVNLSYFIMENISEGIIGINSDKKIKIINKSAKDIFGISSKQKYRHAAGSLKNGDIIIIGDNSLGVDDGGMDIETLNKLGVKGNLYKETAFVYIGRFGEGGEYNFSINNIAPLSINSTINGVKISCSIDFIHRKIEIRVDDKEFIYPYIIAAGHLVILDGQTLELKFFQSKGYSVRRESLRDILEGAIFTEKKKNENHEFDVINKDIGDILGNSKSISMLTEIFKNSKNQYSDIYDEINGRPVRCSIFPVYNNNVVQMAVLKVEDLSEVNKILLEKEEILKKLIELEDNAYNPFNIENAEIGVSSNYIKKAAISSLTILLAGESGTGKSQMARAIHNYSKRNNERFVEINCGAIAESLLESELFGYIGGAFTGANKDGKIGLIEYAEGGTVFLDEISELPVNLQVKLLHVIQEKKIIPVGGTEAVYVNVRFICASNKDLLELTSKGLFREDLYYRINVMPIKMPSLRERKADLYPITQNIISRICRREGYQHKYLTNEAFNVLYNYNFPGNIRELENILERAINISEGAVINEMDIILPIGNNKNFKNLAETVAEAEKNIILYYIKHYNGDKQKVMETLGIKKTAFYDKLKKYNIDIN